MNEDNDEVLLTLDLEGAIHEFTSKYDDYDDEMRKEHEKKDGYATAELIVKKIEQQPIGHHGSGLSDDDSMGQSIWHALFFPDRVTTTTYKPTLMDLLELIHALSSDTFLMIDTPKPQTKVKSSSGKGQAKKEKKKEVKETKKTSATETIDMTERRQNILKLIKRILSCVTLEGALEHGLINFGNILKRVAEVNNFLPLFFTYTPLIVIILVLLLVDMGLGACYILNNKYIESETLHNNYNSINNAQSNQDRKR
jgi:hypothetical protein